MADNSSPDYFQQSITFASPSGPVNVTLPTIDDYNLYNLQLCINYGAQIGASIAMLIVLLLLSKPDKRLSVIMILNCCSLTFNVIRNVLQCLYFTGPFSEIYAQFTGDFSHVQAKEMAVSVAARIFTLLLQVCVELSLYLQARVVCVTLHKLYRQLTLVFSAFVATLAVAVRLAYMVQNDKLIVEEVRPVGLAELGSAANITTCISIIWFCTIFVTKLGVALHQRWKMGLRQFGPMQILIIMGCQTLLVPGTST